MLNEKDKSRLENYLLKIETHLRGISVSDRSDILLELDSHIKDSLSSGEQPLKEILQALGDPVLVANRYLLAKGVKPVPPKKHTLLKIVGIGALALFAAFFIGMFFLIKNFSPLLSVNEQEGRVIILGGLLDVNEKNGTVSFGKGVINIESDDGDHIEFKAFEQKFKGDLQVKDQKSLEVHGQNGKWSFDSSKEGKLSYNCKIKGLGKQLTQADILDQNSKGRIVFNMGSDILKGAKCKFLIPKTLDLVAELGNGKVELEHLQQNVMVSINNGKIEFDKEPQVAYKFDANVVNGTVKGVPSTNDRATGYNVKLHINNGKISIK